MVKLKIQIKINYEIRIPYFFAIKDHKRRKYLEKLGIGVKVWPKRCYIYR